MNILHINTTDKGGAFQSAYRLHEGLLKQDVASKILVLYQYGDLNEVYPFLKGRDIWQKIKDSVNARLFRRKKEKLLRGLPKAQFSFAESPYDITNHPLVKAADLIHLHWTSEFLDYGSFFMKIDKPVVWTLHDMNPVMGGFHYRSYTLKAYDSLDKVVIEQKQKALQSFNKLNIVSPSKWLQNEAGKSDLMKNFSLHHIPHGLDTTVFKPYDQQQARQFFNLPLDQKIILFVADSLSDERKGFQYLSEALLRLENERVILVTLGSGKIENETIANRSLGFLYDPVQIAMAYSAADVFVIPSVEDNLPNTVLEAMACGLPVVGFHTGGIADMVLDGQNGFIAKPKDSRDLAEKIRIILSGDELRSKMGEIARETAVREYSQEIQVHHHKALYKSLLS